MTRNFISMLLASALLFAHAVPTPASLFKAPAATSSSTTVNGTLTDVGGAARASIEADGSDKGFISKHVIYASQAGAFLNSNLETGGGTDSYAILQQQLNKAATGAPLHLIIDGPVLSSGMLLVYSNTTVQCINGGGIYAAKGTNATMIRNAHPTTGTITDRDISIIGCRLNGNAANQVGTGLFGTQTADGTLIGAIQMYGVEKFLARDLDIRYAKTIGIHLANTVRSHVDNYEVTSNSPQGGGLQYSGANRRATFANIRGDTYDDLIAVNTDDADWVNGSSKGLGPYIARGDATDISGTNIVCDNCWTVFRMFSSVSRTDRIRLSNISGSVRGNIFHNDPENLVPGNIGAVEIDGVNVTVNSPPQYTVTGLVQLSGRMENVTLRNFKISGLTDTRGALFVRNTAHIRNLTLDGWEVDDTSTAAAGSLPVRVEGYLQHFNLNNVRQTRAGHLSVNDAFIKIQGTAPAINNFSASNVEVERTRYLLWHSAGYLGEPRLAGVRMGNAPEGSTGIRSDVDSIIEVVASNWQGGTAIPFRSTAVAPSAVRRRGDAFPADTTAPAFSSATIDAGSKLVSVTFSEPVAGTDFYEGVTIEKGGATQAISSARRVPGSNTLVIYELASAVAAGSTVTWAYAPGFLQDLSGNALPTTSAQAVSVTTATARAWDKFTAADGTALARRTPSESNVGTAWATFAGTAANHTVISNHARLDASSGAPNAEAVTLDTTHPAVTFAATGWWDRPGGSISLIMRAFDANNFYYLYLDSQGTKFYIRQAGVDTMLSSIAKPHAPNVPYRMSCTFTSANNATCQVDGEGTVGGGPYATFPKATRVGLRGYSAVTYFDDITVSSIP